MSINLQRVLLARRVVQRRADREVWRRIGTKASAYLRGLALANDVGLTPTELADVGACMKCPSVWLPHVHVFGQKLAITHFHTTHDAALAVAASHTFRQIGSPHTWSKQKSPRDHKDRHRQRYERCVARIVAMCDKYAKARHLLKHGNQKARVRACETLELDVSVYAPAPTPPPLWRDVLNKRTSKRNKHKVRGYRHGAIQTYRSAV